MRSHCTLASWSSSPLKTFFLYSSFRIFPASSLKIIWKNLYPLQTEEPNKHTSNQSLSGFWDAHYLTPCMPIQPSSLTTLNKNTSCPKDQHCGTILQCPRAYMHHSWSSIPLLAPLPHMYSLLFNQLGSIHPLRPTSSKKSSLASPAHLTSPSFSPLSPTVWITQSSIPFYADLYFSLKPGWYNLPNRLLNSWGAGTQPTVSGTR